MIKRNFFYSAILLLLLGCLYGCAASHDTPGRTTDSLSACESWKHRLGAELRRQWPDNRTVNLVFHGHSVPTGYGVTPQVNTLDAYPHQVLHALKELYPYAVVNVITTSIGGENSLQGAARFERDVLTHRPDVLFIDYALNDRFAGLPAARRAWRKMIVRALRRGIPVILLTPTPDTAADILNPDDPLAQHARQIRELAARYRVGLVDSYAAFGRLKREGDDLDRYMSQPNHPNARGHRVVADLIMDWFR
jgi:lysophospholipase L1-like esterase